MQISLFGKFANNVFKLFRKKEIVQDEQVTCNSIEKKERHMHLKAQQYVVARGGC